jgi:hypothetical protein
MKNGFVIENSPYAKPSIKRNGALNKILLGKKLIKLC